MASFAEIRSICERASDAAVEKGDPQAKVWLRRQFANHQDSIYNPSPCGQREEAIDFQIDGIWYTLSVGYGYKGQETWGCHRDLKRSPEIVDVEAENAKRKAFEAMFK